MLDADTATAWLLLPCETADEADCALAANGPCVEETETEAEADAAAAERRGNADSDGNMSAQLNVASNTGARAGAAVAATALISDDFDDCRFASSPFRKVHCF